MNLGKVRYRYERFSSDWGWRRIGAFLCYLGSSNFGSSVVEEDGMCGRVKLTTDVSEIRITFRIPPDYPTPNFPPSWNVAPTDSRYDPKAGRAVGGMGYIRKIAVFSTVGIVPIIQQSRT